MEPEEKSKNTPRKLDLCRDTVNIEKFDLYHFAVSLETANFNRVGRN